jgi:hypothetical protein
MPLLRRDALVEADLYRVDPLLHGWEDYELRVRVAMQE